MHPQREQEAQVDQHHHVLVKKFDLVGLNMGDDTQNDQAQRAVEIECRQAQKHALHLVVERHRVGEDQGQESQQGKDPGALVDDAVDGPAQDQVAKTGCEGTGIQIGHNAQHVEQIRCQNRDGVQVDGGEESLKIVEELGEQKEQADKEQAKAERPAVREP